MTQQKWQFDDENIDHEDNYSSASVIWDGRTDVFQRSRESEGGWFFLQPLSCDDHDDVDDDGNDDDNDDNQRMMNGGEK